MENNYDPDWMKKILDQLKGDIGEGEPTPSTPKEEEKPGPGVIVLNETDVESGEMFNRQQQYEEELAKYPIDHPKNLFPHNFLREKFLPVVVVGGKNEEEPDFEKIAQEMVENAYIEKKGGKLILGQVKFCKIWKARFNYASCGNSILTPHGSITQEKFRDQVVCMISCMGTEQINVDALATHITSTYISLYYTEKYVDENKIPFKNGDLVLNEDKKGFTFYEGRLSPVPYRFDYNFKNIPNCEEPPFTFFREWRDGLFDQEDQYTLKQMLGYLMIPTTEAQEAFFIIGKGGSGKSILTDCIIKKMLGSAAFPMSISTFFTDKFQTSSSVNKLCVYDDDIGKAHMSNADSGRFKDFTTSETIQVEKKYYNATTAKNTARIVCLGNHMIVSDDKSDGFIRRIHPIYTKPRVIEKIDHSFKKKVGAEIELIVLWALEGLLELYRNGGVPYRSERTKQNLEHYAESQKWEEQFITDCFCFMEDTVTYSTDIQAALQDWMKENMEMCGEGPLPTKFKAVTRWLQDEGEEKYGFIYRRGIKRGNSYNARGYVNMSLRKPVTDPSIFYNEKGKLVLNIRKRKPKDNIDTGKDV